MPIWDRALYNTSLSTSSKAPHRNVIKIIADGGGLALLHKRFGCAAAKSCDRLGSIPSHGLFFTPIPIRNPPNNFEHFGGASLCFRRFQAGSTIYRFRLKADGLCKLPFGHAETLRYTPYRNVAFGIQECHHKISAPKPRLIHPSCWGRANIAPGFLLRGRGSRSSLDLEGTRTSGGKGRFFSNSHRCHSLCQIYMTY